MGACEGNRAQGAGGNEFSAGSEVSATREPSWAQTPTVWGSGEGPISNHKAHETVIRIEIGQTPRKVPWAWRYKWHYYCY